MSETIPLGDLLGIEPQKTWIANCGRCGRFCHGRSVYYESTGEWDDLSECAPGRGCKKPIADTAHEGGDKK